MLVCVRETGVPECERSTSVWGPREAERERSSGRVCV